MTSGLLLRGGLFLGIALGAMAGPASPQIVTTDASVKLLADSLWSEIVAGRGLRPTGAVTVDVEEPEQLLEQAQQVGWADRVGDAEAVNRLLESLGLDAGDGTPSQAQPAGFYDIEARTVRVASGLAPAMQAEQLSRALVQALQDQHFSVRVRRRLGFDNRDARRAWEALLEGDANLTTGECLRRKDALARSVGQAPGATQANGSRFVAALRSRGGWRRVDLAYIQPPTSTEQILHPERYLDELDAPVRVVLPDLRGFLGPGAVPVAQVRLGELDLRRYFGRHLDAAMAKEAAEGWGGCEAVLYSSSAYPRAPLVIGSVWDSETDAVEAFDGFLRAIVARYGDSNAVHELSSDDRAVWRGKSGTLHAVTMSGRQVIVLEHVPAASLERTLDKLQRDTRFEDPTPDVRAQDKQNLPWHHALSTRDSVLTLQVDLPSSWKRGLPADDPLTIPDVPGDVVLTAYYGRASLQVALDREAHDQLGDGGFAHYIADQLQVVGHSVFILHDQPGSPNGLPLYQLVFSQQEGSQGIVYYIAVAALQRGFGYVVVREPRAPEVPSLQEDVDSVVASLRLVPYEDAAAKLASEPLGSSLPRHN